MTNSGRDYLDYDPTQENVHAVTDPEKCREMEKKYGWKLLDMRPTGNPILKVDCIFHGQQTSFEDERYD